MITPLRHFFLSTKVSIVSLFTGISFLLLGSMSIGVYGFFHNGWYTHEVQNLTEEIGHLGSQTYISFSEASLKNISIRLLSTKGEEIESIGIFKNWKIDPKVLTKIEQIEKKQFIVLSRFIHKKGWIQIAKDVSDLSKNDSLLLTILIFSTLIGTILSALIGYFFAQHILHPMRQMTRSAKTISFQRLHERLPIPNTYEEDELRELAQTFNTMLDRLQSSAENLQQFIGDASHELKTPIAVLNSSLELLKRKKPKELPTVLELIEQVKEIENMIENLLILAHEEEIPKTEIPLSPLIQRSLAYLSETIKEKNITIKTTLSESIKLTTDDQFSHISDNLIGNAIKHSPEDSTIFIYLTQKHFKVCNTGQTIPAEDLKHLFDRFWRSDEARNRKGSGLGLAITKKIVDLHGWSISAKSNKEKTCFTVLF